jgi:uncharacterized protein DUF2568
VLRDANLAVRFLLELAALAAVAWWGWTVSAALAIVLPLAVAVVWGLFVSPKAKFRVSRPIWYALQVVIFGVASLALASVWSVAAAVGFALVVTANLTMLALLDR